MIMMNLLQPNKMGHLIEQDLAAELGWDVEDLFDDDDDRNNHDDEYDDDDGGNDDDKETACGLQTMIGTEESRMNRLQSKLCLSVSH